MSVLDPRQILTSIASVLAPATAASTGPSCYPRSYMGERQRRRRRRNCLDDQPEADRWDHDSDAGDEGIETREAESRESEREGARENAGDGHSEGEKRDGTEDSDNAETSGRTADVAADRGDGETSGERDDPDDPEQPNPLDVSVTFLDCRRVHVVGAVSDVILRISFDPSDGMPGTITEPVGAVDGERTIDAADEFDLPPERTVLSEVELFESEEVATPGLGDLRVKNPSLEACLEEHLGFGVDSPDYSIEFLDCETVRVTGTFAAVLLSFAWWDEDGSVGTISEPVGGVDGERTINVSEEFGAFAYGPVFSSVHAFAEGTPVVPGGGDLIVENPFEGMCRDAVLEAYDGPGVPDGLRSSNVSENADDD